MTDNSNIDHLTRDILLESKLELTNPDFESLLMNKIRSEEQKKSTYQNVILFFVRFITLDAIIFSLSKIFGINISDISSGIDIFSNGITTGIQTVLSNIEYLVLIYFIILAIVVILLSNILSSRHNYSGN